MQKVAIVTDSIACLTREIVAEYGVEIIPINFYASGKLYRDGVDVTPSEAYELFIQDPDSFQTSAASPLDCLQSFRNASRIAPKILCITLSTKLSTMYNAALEAKDIARTELPDLHIEVIDSTSATPSEGFVALAAARAAAADKDLSEVISAAEKVRDNVFSIIVLDTIRHVYRSGRIPKIASQVGSMLNIKPILTVSKVVSFAGAVRSRKAGIDRLIQIMKDKTSDKLVHVAVTHAYAPDEAISLKERIASEFNCAEILMTEFSPIMGYACGTGTVGAAFYTDS